MFLNVRKHEKLRTEWAHDLPSGEILNRQCSGIVNKLAS